MTITKLSPPKSDLEALTDVALHGPAIFRAANEPVSWVWPPSIAAGAMVTIGGPPTSGKSSLLFRFLVARAHDPAQVPLQVLERDVTQAPADQFIVVLEEENRRRTARRILRAIKEVGDEVEAENVCARFRVLTAERPVIVGDATWARIERLVAQGLVSDVVVDTLASSTTEAANDEQEQAMLYKKFKKLLAAYPSSEKRPPPVLWLLVHSRKGESEDFGTSIAGSRQRVAQTDTLLVLEAVLDSDQVHVASILNFSKERDNFDGEPSRPIRFDRHGQIKSKKTAMLRRVLETLKKQPGPHTISSITKGLNTRRPLVEEAILLGESQNLVKRECETIKGVTRETFFLVTRCET